MGWFVVLLYLIHSLLLFHFPSYTFSLCNPHDLSALLLFNNSFTVNNTIVDHYHPWYYHCPTNVSSKIVSWNKNTDCCKWDGVTCDTMSGHVIGLDLSCSMLQGQFHPNITLFHLTHLQQLNLTLNFFYGDIPSSISHLSKLISLDLSFNYGGIDPYSDELGMAMRLDPSTWKKLIFNASDIREIFLGGINMSSINESSLSLLLNLSSSLVSLSLPGTGLQGNLPSRILYLPNLQQLTLSGNVNLRGQLPKSNCSSKVFGSL
ncbi:hypothetical protein RIF29_17682 [Crotalaria pallida]|uniref:Leucine-rich repeat-containing N-terminal plant-type domain-containing protein n=1 Tax=Crotalaria pallida TaxID=3830 RepID=A0AAN9FKX2_CROPI